MCFIGASVDRVTAALMGLKRSGSAHGRQRTCIRTLRLPSRNFVPSVYL